MKRTGINTYNFDPYLNGLLKSIEQTILVCENQLEMLKAEKFEFNTPRQLTNSGQIRAYSHLKVTLLNKRNKLVKYGIPV